MTHTLPGNSQDVSIIQNLTLNEILRNKLEPEITKSAP
jgi:hypothetical protein